MVNYYEILEVSEKASKEVNAFCEQFGFAPTLWKLLQEEGGVNNE